MRSLILCLILVCAVPVAAQAPSPTRCADLHPLVMAQGVSAAFATQLVVACMDIVEAQSRATAPPCPVAAPQNASACWSALGAAVSAGAATAPATGQGYVLPPWPVRPDARVVAAQQVWQQQMLTAAQAQAQPPTVLGAWTPVKP